MYLVTTISIIVNIVSIIVLLIGLVHTFEQPKRKAVYGYFIAGTMLTYLFILTFLAVYELLVNRYLVFLVFVLCIMSPFIIGKLVKYETLKKYTIVQIMFFVLSLVTLLIKF
jgi:hypothetical protein